jgi:hypothetical protein
VPFGWFGRTIFPFALLLPPLMELLPVAVLGLAPFVGSTPGLFWWAVIAASATLGWWVVVYSTVRENPLYAFGYPLGALVILYIFVTAVIRGRRVSWKGRTYISS